MDDAWLSDRQLGGLSSGEGLIWAVRDPVHGYDRDKRTKQLVEQIIDPGISDKRLFVVESEFASVLRRMNRENNTLSMTLRQAWDGAKLQTMTKASPASATDAHGSLIAHVTRDEMKREMAAGEAFNGFSNRFLWWAVQRSKLLPDGGELAQEDFASIRQRLRVVIESAALDTFQQVCRDSEAKELWHGVYGDLTADRPGAMGAATARAAAQVMRLSLIYAVLDGRGIIQPVHLRAALAVWRYCHDSAACLFAIHSGDSQQEKHFTFIRDQGGCVSVRDFQRKFHRDFPTVDDAKAKLVEYAQASLGEWHWNPPPSGGGVQSHMFALFDIPTADGDTRPVSDAQSGRLSPRG